jgi:hypothetical protein
MAGQTFNFPYHKVRTEYPESTTNIQFGKNWVFPIKPNAPDQRTFVLTMRGMQYFLNGVDPLPDPTIVPERNAKALSNFYETHQQWDTFIYPHPVYGNITCRFKNPLRLPEGIDGGTGLLPEFEIVLIEEPA